MQDIRVYRVYFFEDGEVVPSKSDFYKTRELATKAGLYWNSGKEGRSFTRIREFMQIDSYNEYFKNWRDHF